MGGSKYRRSGAKSGPVDTVYLGVFRTDELREMGGWNEAFPTNQDFELNRRMSTLGDIWFEAGLEVGYVGRARLREIWSQYHRFGRWKVRYWRRTGDNPQPRQLVLLAAPLLPFGAFAGVAAVLGLKSAATVAGALVVPAFLAIDAIGGSKESAEVPTRFLAGATNVIVGLGWSSGVARQMLLRHDSAEEPQTRVNVLTPRRDDQAAPETLGQAA